MMVLVYKVLLSSDEFELFEGLTHIVFLSLRFHVKSHYVTILGWQNYSQLDVKLWMLFVEF